MGCNESLETLKQINQKLQAQNDALFGNTNSIVYRDYPGWTKTKTGKKVIYEQTITYTGSTVTIDRPFNVSTSIKRIDQVWNDATAKDIDVRMYSDVSNTLYTQLEYALANTSLSDMTSAKTESELSFKPGSKLQFRYANNTVGKICSITIVCEED